MKGIFLKAIPSNINLNWLGFISVDTLPAMSEQLETALPVGTFRRLVSPGRVQAIERRPQFSLANPARKHSVIAAVFLVLYVSIYLAIGFLGISLIQRVWAAVLE